MLAALLAASLTLAPAHTPAPTRPLREVLRVEPGATCLTPGVLADTIQSWLGRDMVEAAVAQISVRGDPERADAVAIALEIRGELVERSFDPAPSTCGELHAVVGLAIAIAVDAAVLEVLGYEVVGPGEEAVAPAKDPERPPLTRARRVDPVPTQPPPPRRAQVAVTAAIHGGAWLAVLPGVAGGGGAQLELGWRRWLDLRIGLWGGYGGRRAIDGESALTLALVGGRVDVCAALAGPRLRPRLCFGTFAGALQIGAKAPEVRDAVGAWAGLAVAPELRIWATRRFALDLRIDLVVPVVRTVVAERDPSKEGMIGASIVVPPVGVMLGLGAAFTIR